jgi:hypothetical protein
MARESSTPRRVARCTDSHSTTARRRQSSATTSTRGAIRSGRSARSITSSTARANITRRHSGSSRTSRRTTSAELESRRLIGCSRRCSAPSGSAPQPAFATQVSAPRAATAAPTSATRAASRTCTRPHALRPFAWGCGSSGMVGAGSATTEAAGYRSRQAVNAAIYMDAGALHVSRPLPRSTPADQWVRRSRVAHEVGHETAKRSHLEAMLALCAIEQEIRAAGARVRSRSVAAQRRQRDDRPPRRRAAPHRQAT